MTTETTTLWDPLGEIPAARPNDTQDDERILREARRDQLDPQALSWAATWWMCGGGCAGLIAIFGQDIAASAFNYDLSTWIIPAWIVAAACVVKGFLTYLKAQSITTAAVDLALHTWTTARGWRRGASEDDDEAKERYPAFKTLAPTLLRVGGSSPSIVHEWWGSLPDQGEPKPFWLASLTYQVSQGKSTRTETDGLLALPLPHQPLRSVTLTHETLWQRLGNALTGSELQTHDEAFDRAFRIGDDGSEVHRRYILQLLTPQLRRELLAKHEATRASLCLTPDLLLVRLPEPLEISPASVTLKQPQMSSTESEALEKSFEAMVTPWREIQRLLH
jgi:hypothetical protein